VLVHNWARFRYGVFSEAPYKNLDNNEEFYFNKNGDIEATRCNLNITGHIRNPIVDSQICNQFQEKNGLPSIDCIYEDDIKPKLVEKRIGSLMYRPFLTQVSQSFIQQQVKY
jgi:calcium-activated chloride channel regulator 4